MNAQFKKGVLELIVLESVRKKAMYGYELVEEVSKVVDVNEGTIYPLLKRLTNEKYFETYLRESTEGPPRPVCCTGMSWSASGHNWQIVSGFF